ncbi:MAG: succinate dehydrogenase, hydrophobic membrane anchor protein [Acetobacteraceae bacterium]|nr:succinate dehydrogenase, hydrophobic membrane anchor protein [Pseudomonadota bacterium]
MSDASKAPHIDIMRSPLGRARGLGSTHKGSAHWWLQRVTAVALVPLGLWFIFSVVGLTGATREQMTAWIASPVSLSLMLALIAATFYHMWLGLQVVIEDYVHQESAKIVAISAVKGLSILLGLICIVSALKIGL